MRHYYPHSISLGTPKNNNLDTLSSIEKAISTITGSKKKTARTEKRTVNKNWPSPGE
jgi:hypothetical protein